MGYNNSVLVEILSFHLCTLIAWLLVFDIQGLQWCLLTDEEIIPRILAMEGRRGRRKSLGFEHEADISGVDPLRSRHRKKRTPTSGEAEGASAANAKLLRRLEAQGESVPSKD